jgi:hypothetical protein
MESAFQQKSYSFVIFLNNIYNIEINRENTKLWQNTQGYIYNMSRGLSLQNLHVFALKNLAAPLSMADQSLRFDFTGHESSSTKPDRCRKGATRSVPPLRKARHGMETSDFEYAYGHGHGFNGGEEGRVRQGSSHGWEGKGGPLVEE